MSSSPAVSVVLPVHNCRGYVELSVRSILDQDFANFELVIGDDGSDDGTSDVLVALAAQDNRIRLLRRPLKSGLAESANWVVSKAQAPLIAMAHADDVYHRQRLSTLQSLLARHPDAVLVGALAEGIDSRGELVQPPNVSRLMKRSSFAPFAHSTIMFRADAFKRVGGYRAEANVWEDLDLYWRMSQQGRILVSPQVLTSYRHSSVSIRERYAESLEQALERMYRSVELYNAGKDWTPLFGTPFDGRIHPRIFVARSWVRLWNGNRSDVLGGMLARARLRPDLLSLQSLAFVIWATLSPRTLRRLIQLVRGRRNAHFERKLRGVEYVEWPQPLESLPHRNHRCAAATVAAGTK